MINSSIRLWIRRGIIVCGGHSYSFRGISRGGNSVISSSFYRQRHYSGTKREDVVKNLPVSGAQQGKESSGASTGNSKYNLSFPDIMAVAIVVNISKYYSIYF